MNGRLREGQGNNKGIREYGKGKNKGIGSDEGIWKGKQGYME